MDEPVGLVQFAVFKKKILVLICSNLLEKKSFDYFYK